MPPSFVPDNIYYSGQTFSRLQELSETKRESPELQLPNSSQFSAFHKRNEKGRAANFPGAPQTKREKKSKGKKRLVISKLLPQTKKRAYFGCGCLFRMWMRKWWPSQRWGVFCDEKNRGQNDSHKRNEEGEGWEKERSVSDVEVRFRMWRNIKG